MAGGKRGDEFLSQVMPAVVMEMTPELEARFEAHAEARLEDLRKHAREKDQSIALEIKLLHNTVQRVERAVTRIADDGNRTELTQVEILRTLRDIRDAQSSTAVESPQLQSMAVETLREIKEMVAAIMMVVTTKTNGHLQES